MNRNSFIKTIASKTQRRRSYDTAQRNDGNFSGAAADVNNHRAGRLGYRQVSAHGSSHRLFDKVCLASARLNGGLENSALLYRSGTTRNAYHDTRLWLPRITTRSCFVNKRGDHGLRHVIVCDNAIVQRMLCRKSVWRMVDHVLCFMTNSKNAVGAALDGNNRRLVDNDTLPRDGYECIGGAKVDSHVVRRRRGGVLYEIKERH